MISKEKFKKVLDRIISETGKTQEDLAIDMKYGKNYFSEILSPTGKMTEKFSNAFLAKYGSYLENPNNVGRGTSENFLNGQRTGKGDPKKKIPFYDAPAVAGLNETDMTPIHAPAGTIDVGDLLHDSQAAIRIYSNSMLPNYPPGCVVGLAKVEKGFIEPGEVYVIETRDRRVLKRLFYKDDDPNSTHILCYSDNIMKFEGGARHGKLAYPPFNLHKKDIIQLFAVTGVIKRNANSVIINR